LCFAFWVFLVVTTRLKISSPSALFGIFYLKPPIENKRLIFLVCCRGNQPRFQAWILRRWGNSYHQDVQSGWWEVGLNSIPPVLYLSIYYCFSFDWESPDLFRWPLIAGRIPGRTAEEIEKYWTSRYSTSQ
jgi:hypothetical protein